MADVNTLAVPGYNGGTSLNSHLEVRHSPFNGLGIFARLDIAPGTLIHFEYPLLVTEIALASHHTYPERDELETVYLEHRFNQLAQSQKAAFMNLSEGSRPFPNQRMRIYKNNAFTIRRQGTCYSGVYLQKSRLNHSCVPNAVDEIDGDSGRSTLFAARPIQAGEEVTICYWYHYDMMTAEQRNAHQQAMFNFVCSCKACDKNSDFRAESDARRKEISELWWLYQGEPPPDLSISDWSSEEAVQEKKDVRRNTPTPEPLSRADRRKTMSRLTKLMEAEGLVNQSLCEMYLRALADLHTLVDPKNGEMQHPVQEEAMEWAKAYVDCRDWKQKLIETATICHGAHSDEVKKFEDHFWDFRTFLWMQVMRNWQNVDPQWAKDNKLNFETEHAIISRKREL